MSKTSLLAGSLTCLIFISYSFGAEHKAIGTFDFPTSGSPEAQAHFELGVGYLHSFGFTQAQHEFKLAQEIEPDFAMAYWGETFTYNHPFIGEWDSQSPMAVLNRLGATSEARLAKAPTAREKGFIRAAEAYAFTPGSVDDRRSAWMSAMQELYAAFPNDDEVAAFTAVSMLAGATAAYEMSDRLTMRAGAIALGLFKKNENHPGAAHYVIHAFDDPIHAPIALEAAFKYADIAPSVSHARHMPTHIFIQHGMWPEVAKWNESAFLAGAELWQPGDRPNDQNHAADWGQYGDLQMGKIERSNWWISQAESVLINNPDDARSQETLRTMKARHIIESQRWHLQPLTEDMNANELLALGMSAAALDKTKLTNDVAVRLGELSVANPHDDDLAIIQHEIAGIAELARARSGPQIDTRLEKSAIDHFLEALKITAKQRLPNGASNPLKPAHELVGEAMLASGQTEWAAELFDESLLRMPRRARSLLGAARAHAKLGHDAIASQHYLTLLEMVENDSDYPLEEASAFVAMKP